jgi:hypothetical protein
MGCSLVNCSLLGWIPSFVALVSRDGCILWWTRHYQRGLCALASGALMPKSRIMNQIGTLKYKGFLLSDRGVYQNFAKASDPFERSYVVQSDQAAVTDHVSINHGNQLSAAWPTSDQI